MFELVACLGLMAVVAGADTRPVLLAQGKGNLFFEEELLRALQSFLPQSRRGPNW
jgi:hypothetical protein